MNTLPEDCHLAYVVSHEAWYANALPDRHPEINVMAAADGGGCAWEFTVEEVDLGNRNPAVRVKVFDDAFAAFGQIPEFFAALAAYKAGTLDEVRALLDGMGAVDETDRRDPATHREPAPTSPLRQAIRAAAVASYATSDGRRVLVIPESAVPAIAEIATGD